MCRVRGQRSGSPLKRGCVGGTVAWALGGRCPGGLGWVEGRTSALSLRRLRACLIVASFQEPRGRVAWGGGISDSSRLIPVSSTLPHVTKSAFQSAISHLLHTHCVHRAPKCSPTTVTVLITACPHHPGRYPDPSAPGLISFEAWGSGT